MPAKPLAWNRALLDELIEVGPPNHTRIVAVANACIRHANASGRRMEAGLRSIAYETGQHYGRAQEAMSWLIRNGWLTLDRRIARGGRSFSLTIPANRLSASPSVPTTATMDTADDPSSDPVRATLDHVSDPVSDPVRATLDEVQRSGQRSTQGSGEGNGTPNSVGVGVVVGHHQSSLNGLSDAYTGDQDAASLNGSGDGDPIAVTITETAKARVMEAIEVALGDNKSSNRRTPLSADNADLRDEVARVAGLGVPPRRVYEALRDVYIEKNITGAVILTLRNLPTPPEERRLAETVKGIGGEQEPSWLELSKSLARGFWHDPGEKRGAIRSLVSRIYEPSLRPLAEWLATAAYRREDAAAAYPSLIGVTIWDALSDSLDFALQLAEAKAMDDETLHAQVDWLLGSAVDIAEVYRPAGFVAAALAPEMMGLLDGDDRFEWERISPRVSASVVIYTPDASARLGVLYGLAGTASEGIGEQVNAILGRPIDEPVLIESVETRSGE